jgi:chaperonin cofactor prefoldin
VKIFRFMIAALIALAIATGPSVANAQQAAAAPSPELQRQVQSMLAEMQQIHGQLQELQARALQDPQLSAAQASIGENLRNAMQRADPGIEQGLQRLEAINAEAVTARETGNNARLQQLGDEVQQIEIRFQTAQQQALQAQPQLATQMQTFQTSLEAKMAQLDPRAEQLIAQFQELQTRLAGVMQGAQQP